MLEVREERTGWRDQEMSDRHRKWGWDCPMQDIDFLAVEYDHFLPVAIVEYKHEAAELQTLANPSYKVLANLGRMANLPVFAVRYGTGLDWYNVVPIGGLATILIPKRVRMTEMEWVSFLYRLRGRTIPENIAKEIVGRKQT